MTDGRPGLPREAWKYTTARQLFGGVPDDVVRALPAASSTGHADRDAWGLAHLVDLLAPTEGVSPDTITAEPGLSASHRSWRALDGDVVRHQWFDGAGTHLAEDTVRVAAGAHLTHVRVVDAQATARHAGLVVVEVEAGGHYELVSVVGGGAVVRVDVVVHLRGEGARTSLSGLSVVGGDHHVDHHVTVFHDAPAATSSQDFRALVDDSGVSVFTGKVVVAPGADGADASQIHRALLLSDRAMAKARPQLEIHTDEVKASHGTAVGTLDSEAMFYLQQRGLDPALARSLLVDAFAAAIVARAPESSQDVLRERVAGWRS